ncbi:MAG: protein-L-isoaspartate O-methyltransferase family protein [Alphaproteobacteria bacterium]
MIDFAALRRNMIEGQIRPNRVTDPALVEALSRVPREGFVPAGLKANAYVDEDLPLGGGRFLTEPLVLARLIQAARPANGAKVLDIGCATGYGAAVLAELGVRVVALEDQATLADRARAALGARAGVVEVVVGPLRAGWPAAAPYDAIIIEGGVAEVPPALLDQLADGGSLAAVLIDTGVGRLARLVKQGGVVSRVDLYDAAVPALDAFAAAPKFAF